MMKTNKRGKDAVVNIQYSICLVFIFIMPRVETDSYISVTSIFFMIIQFKYIQSESRTPPPSSTIEKNLLVRYARVPQLLPGFRPFAP